MQTEKKYDETITISSEKLLSLVGEFFGGQDYPNPDDPQPPGPWDPYIRKSLNDFRNVLERQRLFPHEEAWLSFFARGRAEIFDAINPHSLAELNPQPLPPRAKLLASITQQVIDRALLIQETADAINQAGEQQGIIIVGGRLKQFITDIDELCPRIPRKFPKPKGSEDRFSTLELLTAGAVCSQNAAIVADESLRQELRNAGAKLIEMAISRM